MAATLAGALSTGPVAVPSWHADYADAVAETKRDDQPLLVVFDVESDAKRRLDPTLLKSAEAGRYALCRIDASTEYGKKVAAGFKVTELPHVAIIDKQGSVVLDRLEAGVTADEFSSALKRFAAGTPVRHTVAKPVVTDVQGPAAAAPAANPAPVYTPAVNPVAQPMIQYPAPAARPYCPSCQLRNRF